MHKLTTEEEKEEDGRDRSVMFHFNLHPINMTNMENTFSALVLGEILPKPTLVRLLNVK